MIKMKSTLREFKRDLESIAVFGRTGYAREMYYKWRPHVDRRHKEKEKEYQ